MTKKTLYLFAITIVLALTAVLLLNLSGVEAPDVEPLPDFSQYESSDELKEAFFDYLTPIIDEQNALVAEQRAKVLALSKKLDAGKALKGRNLKSLRELATQYRLVMPESDAGEAEDPADAESLDPFSTLEQQQQLVARLTRRVDEIPLELALVQAAKESGWGRSRFAKTANNLFGQWCYTEGCGVVPSARAAGATHELAAFDNIGDTIQNYLLNLNTHDAYKPLRDIRARLRDSGEPLNGLVLADGLVNYSQRRDAYVSEVKAMIRSYRKFEQSETPS